MDEVGSASRLFHHVTAERHRLVHKTFLAGARTRERIQREVAAYGVLVKSLQSEVVALPVASSAV